jgi:hypothetical protein
MLGPSNISALPALRAAVEAYRQHAPPHLRRNTFTHTLHTFGGCTYRLTFTSVDAETLHVEETSSAVMRSELQSSKGEQASRSPSHHANHCNSSDEGTAYISHASSDLTQASTAACTSEEGVDCSANIRLTFTHAIPFTTLDSLHSCADELAKRCVSLAPHCTVAAVPASCDELPNSGGGSLQLIIPAAVTPAERYAAFRWAAEWRVLTLLPVLDNFLRRCQAAEVRQTLLLSPLSAMQARTLNSAAAATTTTTHHHSSTLQAISDAHLAQTLILCATPLPTRADASPSGRTDPAAAPFIFDGTLSLTTCIASRDAREAVVLQEYLDAFAAAENTNSVLFLVHTSPPPPGLTTPMSNSEVLLSLRNPPPHVWWCTILLSPYHMQKAGVVEKALGTTLRLRETLLFHVHQESSSINTLLRQKMASYATWF